MCVYVCVCVCEGKYVCVCACVCVRERERESECVCERVRVSFLWRGVGIFVFCFWRAGKVPSNVSCSARVLYPLLRKQPWQCRGHWTASQGRSAVGCCLCIRPCSSLPAPHSLSARVLWSFWGGSVCDLSNGISHPDLLSQGCISDPGLHILRLRRVSARWPYIHREAS